MDALLAYAQLLSLFIHNPIVFLGYNIGDQNIKYILKTIYTYVDKNSDIAEKIRKNFLLVEYEAGSNNQEISEHDIDIDGFATIRINKVKTNDFISIYKSLANLTLPISAMDVRKVQTIVKEIYSGGEVKVKFTEDMDTLNNSDKIIVIGSANTITYVHQTVSEMMSNYFKIIEESNSQLLALINKHQIHANQFFPAYGFGKICNEILKIDSLKHSQKNKLDSIKGSMIERCKNRHTNIENILSDTAISTTYKCNAIFWAVMEHQIDTEEFELYLKNYSNKHDTGYKKLLCAYDYIKYSGE